MSKEISDKELNTLQEPIRESLETYGEISDGQLVFDVDKAAKLELTPDKPNSARSTTDVIYRGDPIGKLYVIAFYPEDGSGDESGYTLSDLEVASPYPRTTKAVPRKKTGTHSEGHLTVVSHRIEDPHADPELFAGTFDLLGLDGKTIKKIGELGQKSTVSVEDMKPLTTLTVGYDSRGERFGDPHAVYSSIPDAVQVCAFLAVSNEVFKQHPDILTSLHAQEPRQV